MKVEYTEELEKLVRLHAECIISLIKAIFNGPLHQSSRWALGKGMWKMDSKSYSFFLHSICNFKKTVCIRTVAFRTNGILVIEKTSFWKNGSLYFSIETLKLK